MSDDPLSPVRQAIIDACDAVAGLTAPDPAYLALVAPGDAPERQAQIASESDCGLVLLGIQERALDVPARGAYRESSAFELVYERAQGNPWKPEGAVRVPTLDAPPQPGDGLIWGPSSSAVAHMEHAVDTSFVGSSRVDLQACKLEYSIVSPK